MSEMFPTGFGGLARFRYDPGKSRFFALGKSLAIA